MIGRRLSICREGVYYLVVMAFIVGGALMRQINLLMLLFGLMAGPLAYNIFSVWRMMAGVRVKRRPPEAVAAGDPMVVELELTNTARRGAAWAVVVSDFLSRVDDGAGEARLSPAVMFTRVPADQTMRTTYRGMLPRRGRYRFGPMTAWTRFPLGFVKCSIDCEAGDPDEILVYPRLGELTHRWSKLREESYQRQRAQQQRRGMLDGDFHSLRPWRTGDSKRWIHWRTSARQGQLMVRQFERQLQRDLALVVELWRPANPEPPHLDAVELAVSFAASVSTELCRRGGCELMMESAANPRSSFRASASQALQQEILTALAVAEADDVDRLPEALAKTLGDLPQNTQVVLVSSRPIDLSDSRRFAALWNDPRLRAMLGRISTIDASNPEMQNYFQAK